MNIAEEKPSTIISSPSELAKAKPNSTAKSNNWQQHILCDDPNNIVTVNIIPLSYSNHMDDYHRQKLEESLDKKEELVALAKEFGVSLDIYHNSPNPDTLYYSPLLCVASEKNSEIDIEKKFDIADRISDIMGDSVSVVGHNEFAEELNNYGIELTKILAKIQKRPLSSYLARNESGSPNLGKG